MLVSIAYKNCSQMNACFLGCKRCVRQPCARARGTLQTQLVDATFERHLTSQVLSRFIDLDYLLAQYVKTPKVITPRTIRTSVRAVLALKHTLSQVGPGMAAGGRNLGGQ